MMNGIARGGPLDGQELLSRFPLGVVVVVDKLAHRAWIYVWQPGDNDATGWFTCREAEGRELDDERRWMAAEGGDYDVVAAPGVM